MNQIVRALAVHEFREDRIESSIKHCPSSHIPFQRETYGSVKHGSQDFRMSLSASIEKGRVILLWFSFRSVNQNIASLSPPTGDAVQGVLRHSKAPPVPFPFSGDPP
jgi:hypothetical protein